MQINTTPTNTTVEVTTLPADNDPKRGLTWTSGPGQGNGYVTPRFRYQKGDNARVIVRAPDFEAQTNLVSSGDLYNSKATDKAPYVVNITLPELRRKIEVEFVSIKGAKFSVDHIPIEGSSASLVFARDNSGAPWQPVTVTAELVNYKTLQKTLTLANVEPLPLLGNKRRQVTIDLEEIQRSLKLSITANESDGRIMLDGKAVGKVPGEINLVFTRPDSNASWSTHVLRVEKEGYEYRPEGAKPGREAPLPFETNLTVEAVQACEQKLILTNFQPVKFFQVPMRRFTVSRGEVILETTNSISAKETKYSDGLSPFVLGKNDELFIVGRMGAAISTKAPGKAGKIVIALPNTESRQGRLEIVGSSISILTAWGAQEPVTAPEPDVYDIDPCITKDGQTVYFSSNRRGQWGIWKKAARSGGGLTPINPGQGVDREPAVFSADGSTRVAFTRYFPKAAPGTPPHIVVQAEDGSSSFAETQPGRSPAWSSDGTRIAYVSPDNKIWWMLANGDKPQKITMGKSVDDSPVWLAGDRQIAYASATSAEEARDGTGNFDLWKVNEDGYGAQLMVANLSFNGMPTMTTDAGTEGGKEAVVNYLYFVSNQGAQRAGDKSWHILYFQLP